MPPEPLLIAVLAGLLLLGWGCAGLRRAGRAYLAGGIETVRPAARRAGCVTAAGALVSVGALLALAGRDAAGGIVLIAVSGVAALLGGLSGKPEPAATIASALAVLGSALLAVLAVSR